MKKIPGVIAVELALGLILFGSAGRVDLPWIWVLLGVHTGAMAKLVVCMPRELMAERMRPGGSGVDFRYRLALIVLMLAGLVIMGLDAGRYGWTPAPAVWLRIAGLAVYVMGLVLSLWSMFANPYFSSVVRVQRERGHEVVSKGPYGWVRHPGYAGMMLALLGQCALVGSAWALIPTALAVGVIAARARMEERYLCEKLEGYAEYAGRVRWRFAPCVV